jgi:hypothetical protein
MYPTWFLPPIAEGAGAIFGVAEWTDAGVPYS